MYQMTEATRPFAIKTIVSLNPIMIDGTGMCGGCRVMIDGKSEFACVDGPEFDAHKVDFGVLVQRNGMYRDAEQRSMAAFRAKACDPADFPPTSRNTGEKRGTPDQHVCVAEASTQGDQR